MVLYLHYLFLLFFWSEIIPAGEHLLTGGSQENGVFVLSHIGAFHVHQARIAKQLAIYMYVFVIQESFYISGEQNKESSKISILYIYMYVCMYVCMYRIIMYYMYRIKWDHALLTGDMEWLDRRRRDFLTRTCSWFACPTYIHFTKKIKKIKKFSI